MLMRMQPLKPLMLPQLQLECKASGRHVSTYNLSLQRILRNSHACVTLVFSSCHPPGPLVPLALPNLNSSLKVHHMYMDVLQMTMLSAPIRLERRSGLKGWSMKMLRAFQRLAPHREASQGGKPALRLDPRPHFSPGSRCEIHTKGARVSAQMAVTASAPNPQAQSLAHGHDTFQTHLQPDGLTKGMAVQFPSAHSSFSSHSSSHGQQHGQTHQQSNAALSNGYRHGFISEQPDTLSQEGSRDDSIRYVSRISGSSEGSQCHIVYAKSKDGAGSKPSGRQTFSGSAQAFKKFSSNALAAGTAASKVVGKQGLAASKVVGKQGWAAVRSVTTGNAKSRESKVYARPEDLQAARAATAAAARAADTAAVRAADTAAARAADTAAARPSAAAGSQHPSVQCPTKNGSHARPQHLRHESAPSEMQHDDATHANVSRVPRPRALPSPRPGALNMKRGSAPVRRQQNTPEPVLPGVVHGSTPRKLQLNQAGTAPPSPRVQTRQQQSLRHGRPDAHLVGQPGSHPANARYPSPRRAQHQQLQRLSPGSVLNEQQPLQSSHPSFTDVRSNPPQQHLRIPKIHQVSRQSQHALTPRIHPPASPRIAAMPQARVGPEPNQQARRSPAVHHNHMHATQQARGGLMPDVMGTHPAQAPYVQCNSPVQQPGQVRQPAAPACSSQLLQQLQSQSGPGGVFLRPYQMQQLMLLLQQQQQPQPQQHQPQMQNLGRISPSYPRICRSPLPGLLLPLGSIQHDIMIA